MNIQVTKVGSVISIGLIMINMIVYWCQNGLGASWYVVILACPGIAFTWVSLWSYRYAERLLVRAAWIAIARGMLVGCHLIPCLYFIYSWKTWSEGTEFAELFVMHFAFTTLVLVLALCFPRYKREPGRMTTGSEKSLNS